MTMTRANTCSIVVRTPVRVKARTPSRYELPPDSRGRLLGRGGAVPCLPELRGGLRLQRLPRIQIGGTPRSRPWAHGARSPMHWVRAIANSGAPRAGDGVRRRLAARQ